MAWVHKGLKKKTKHTQQKTNNQTKANTYIIYDILNLSRSKASVSYNSNLNLYSKTLKSMEIHLDGILVHNFLIFLTSMIYLLYSGSLKYSINNSCSYQ